MPRLLTYSSQELLPELKCQILSFLRLNWPEGFRGENQLRDWISPAEEHPVHCVLVEQDIIISHTEVKWIYFDHADETYKAYGLSGVFTYPAFRGQGYGTQIVRAGTDLIRQSDADVGMLWCNQRLEGFYAQNGWAPMRAAVTLIVREHGSVSHTAKELLMMLFVSEKGKRGRAAFERDPVHWVDDTW